MDAIGLVAILVCIIIAGAVSRRIQNTIITLPMIYVFFGFVIGFYVLGLVRWGIEDELVHIIAELTLILVLSTDASRISLRALFRDYTIPTRLLAFGLPLTMICGALLARFMFPGFGVWEAAILAIVLAPTDASLGQSVLTNLRVPVRVRQALNIESGLNDGIAMPFLLLAIALAISTETAQSESAWLRLAVGQIVYGVLAGGLVGFLGMKLIQWGRKSGWMSINFQKISSLAMALLAYGVAELLGGNGYIAAFCFGLASSRAMNKEESEPLYEYAEVETTLLMLLTYIIFGMVMLPAALEHINRWVVLYALLSLTLVRMIPVGISLIGARVKPSTTLFLGWFGPRGVASILYVLTVLEAEQVASEDLIYTVAMITVLISIFAHGMTAAPLAKWYGNRMVETEKISPDAPEIEDVPEMPLRTYPKPTIR